MCAPTCPTLGVMTMRICRCWTEYRQCSRQSRWHWATWRAKHRRGLNSNHRRGCFCFCFCLYTNMNCNINTLVIPIVSDTYIFRKQDSDVRDKGIVVDDVIALYNDLWLYFMFVLHVCTSCLYFMFVLHFCTSCLYFTFVLHFCTSCLYFTFVLHVCTSCLYTFPRASRVCFAVKTMEAKS